MNLDESTVEAAALEWFGALGYTVGHGPHFAPAEPAAERDSFGEVVLVGRLHEAIRRLNPAIGTRTVATLRDTLPPKLLNGEVPVKVAANHPGSGTLHVIVSATPAPPGHDRCQARGLQSRRA